MHLRSNVTIFTDYEISVYLLILVHVVDWPIYLSEKEDWMTSSVINIHKGKRRYPRGKCRCSSGKRQDFFHGLMIV